MEPLVYSITEACALLGIRRTSLYKIIRSGKLRAIKIGRRTFFLRDEVRRGLQERPSIVPNQGVGLERDVEPSVIVHDRSEAGKPPDGYENASRAFSGVRETPCRNRHSRPNHRDALVATRD